MNITRDLSKIGLDVRIARERREWLAAYELIYARFLARGYVQPNSHGLVYRAAYGHASSRTFIAVERSTRVVGTMTVVADNPDGLQLDAAYGREVNELRHAGRRIIEATGLAISPACPGTVVFFGLIRFMLQFAQHGEYDDLLVAIHPRHQRFYQRWFQVASFGPNRPFQAARNHPAVACHIDLRRVHESVPPHVLNALLDERIPDKTLRAPAMTPRDHAFFCERAQLFSKCPPCLPTHPPGNRALQVSHT